METSPASAWLTEPILKPIAGDCSTLSNSDLATQLELIVPGGIEQNVLAKKLSRWRIGGPVDFLASPRSTLQSSRLVSFLTSQGVPWLVIGHTSNLLFSDERIQGVIIQIGDAMSDVAIQDNYVTCQAGRWVPEFVSFVGRSGLSGLEHAVGIPGTLGGLICMNGGSMRRSISEHVVSVSCLDSNGASLTLTKEACGFGYRSSEIQKNSWIVTEALLKLDYGDPRVIRRAMKSILVGRRKKFPLKLPNCGSVFISNPAIYKEQGPPGSIIERCGLKGFRYGGAAISSLHANFIVNIDNASARDVLHLIRLARSLALQAYDVDLRCEVRFVSQACRLIPAHEVPYGET